jgi:hypothetical protein
MRVSPSREILFQKFSPPGCDSQILQCVALSPVRKLFRLILTLPDEGNQGPTFSRFPDGYSVSLDRGRARSAALSLRRPTGKLFSALPTARAGLGCHPSVSTASPFTVGGCPSHGAGCNGHSRARNLIPTIRVGTVYWRLIVATAAKEGYWWCRRRRGALSRQTCGPAIVTLDQPAGWAFSFFESESARARSPARADFIMACLKWATSSCHASHHQPPSTTRSW